MAIVSGRSRFAIIIPSRYGARPAWVIDAVAMRLAPATPVGNLAA